MPRLALGTKRNPCRSCVSAPTWTVSVGSNSRPVNGRVVAAAPNHYVMIAGHQRSEGEEVVGSIREYEIARKPG